MDTSTKGMMHTPRVIFMIVPLLFVPLVYGISSVPDVCAVPPDSGFGSSKDCNTDFRDGKEIKKCCWRERVPGQILGKEYCQTCTRPTTSYGAYQCEPKEAQLTTTTPGILGDLPTLEQVPTTPTPPPLFGRNVENVPLSGGIEQPLTTTPPPLFGRNIPQGGFEILEAPETTPMFGQIAPEGTTPAGEGEDIQPMNTTFPTPEPFPPPTPGFKAPQTSIDISPDLATGEEDGQDETDDEGNDNIPDMGITEQPEAQQQEEEPSGEGQDTAGPLT